MFDIEGYLKSVDYILSEMNANGFDLSKVQTVYYDANFGDINVAMDRHLSFQYNLGSGKFGGFYLDQKVNDIEEIKKKIVEHKKTHMYFIEE